MKKFSTLSLLLLFLLIVPTFASADSFRQVKQTTMATQLFTQPNGTVVSTIPSKTFVTLFRTENGWAYVTYGKSQGFVQESKLTTPRSTIKIANSKSGLVVKDIPSRATNTLATLTYNMIVEDYGSVGAGWSFVQYGNVTGYVATSFIGVPKTASMYAKHDLQLFNIASPSGAARYSVDSGSAVTTHSTIAGWTYISEGTKRGYVPRSQLATPISDQHASKRFNVYCVASDCQFSSTGRGLYEVTASQELVLRYTNEERKKHGLEPLKLSWAAMRVAQVKSQDMKDHRYFDHTGPTYGDPFDMMKTLGLTYSYAGENIAMGHRNAREVVTAWMNSPGHRANILTREYTHLGVGYEPSGKYWTQIFYRSIDDYEWYQD